MAKAKHIDMANVVVAHEHTRSVSTQMMTLASALIAFAGTIAATTYVDMPHIVMVYTVMAHTVMTYAGTT